MIRLFSKRFSLVGLLALTAAPALAGGVFTFSLPTNPPTGFHWVLNPRASAGLGWTHVDPIPPGPPSPIGAPQPARFAITCTGPGAVRLVFDYVSPDGRFVAQTRRIEMQCF